MDFPNKIAGLTVNVSATTEIITANNGGEFLRLCILRNAWKNRGGVTPEAEGRLTTEIFLILTPKVSWPTGSFLFQRMTSWRP